MRGGPIAPVQSQSAKLSTRKTSATPSADTPLPPLARMASPCRLPSGEDGRGRENRKSMLWRGPAGVSPPPGGVYLRFREREGEALGVPAQGSRPRSTQTTAPLHGAKQPDALRARAVRQRASGNERGKSACGLAQGRRALRSAQRGTERVIQKFPLNIKLLLIVTRMGRDYRPGPRSG